MHLSIKINLYYNEIYLINMFRLLLIFILGNFKGVKFWGKINKNKRYLGILGHTQVGLAN